MATGDDVMLKPSLCECGAHLQTYEVVVSGQRVVFCPACGDSRWMPAARIKMIPSVTQTSRSPCRSR